MLLFAGGMKAMVSFANSNTRKNNLGKLLVRLDRKTFLGAQSRARDHGLHNTKLVNMSSFAPDSHVSRPRLMRVHVKDAHL